MLEKCFLQAIRPSYHPTCSIKALNRKCEHWTDCLQYGTLFSCLRFWVKNVLVATTSNAEVQFKQTCWKLPSSVNRWSSTASSETQTKLLSSSSPGNQPIDSNILQLLSHSTFFFNFWNINNSLMAYFGGRSAFWISSLFKRRDRSVLVIFVIGRLVT